MYESKYLRASSQQRQTDAFCNSGNETFLEIRILPTIFVNKCVKNENARLTLDVSCSDFFALTCCGIGFCVILLNQAVRLSGTMKDL